jgi:hypothetical protein
MRGVVSYLAFVLELLEVVREGKATASQQANLAIQSSSDYTR